MIILQFIYQQLSPAKLCGFLFKTYKANLRKAFFIQLANKKQALATKACTLKSKCTL